MSMSLCRKRKDVRRHNQISYIRGIGVNLSLQRNQFLEIKAWSLAGFKEPSGQHPVYYPSALCASRSGGYGADP